MLRLDLTPAGGREADPGKEQKSEGTRAYAHPPQMAGASEMRHAAFDARRSRARAPGRVPTYSLD